MSEEGFEIPEDLVVRILCRLSVRTLIRFTRVSKRWRFIIISDPQFAKSHLQIASEQRSLTRMTMVTVTDDGHSSELWGMTEYGVPEYWVKLFGSTVDDLPDVFASLNYGWGGWDLCFVTEGGAVVIKLFDSNELVRIGCRKEEKPVCSGRCKIHYVNLSSLCKY
ncbi:hypothetical protein ACLB2K_030345 [Fragaria x ananassa]